MTWQVKHILGSFLMAALLSAGFTANAASADIIKVKEIYSKYSVCRNAESVNVGKFLITLARLVVAFDDDCDSSETDMAIKVLSHMDHIQVLSLDDCSDGIKEDFRRDVMRCDTGGYSVLTSVKDGEDKLDVLVAGDGKKFSELLVLSSGDDPAYIRIRGRMTAEEIRAFLNEIR